MRLSGQLQFGIYNKHIDRVHPDILRQYLNHSDNSDEASGDDTGVGGVIIQQIRADQEKHVRHDGVDVPDHCNPFQDEKMEAKFFKVLAEVVK